jgi:hypothetical protein
MTIKWDTFPPPDCPKNHHVARISAEIGDVVPDTFEYRHIVQHAHIARLGEAFAADFGEVKKTKNIEPVIVGNYNHIVEACQILAVVGEQIVSAPARVAAAMHEDHNGPFFAR